MKKLIYYIIFIISTCIYSQELKDELFVKKYKLDFSIPDNPASKLLGVEPSNLLKPSTAQMISFITSEIFNFNNLSLPKSFGAEIAPILLLNQNTKSAEYNTLLYSFRISIATSRNDTESSKLALGFRATLFDNGNIITAGKKSKYNIEINKILKQNELSKDSLRREYERDPVNDFKITDSSSVEKREEFVNRNIALSKKRLKAINGQVIDNMENKEYADSVNSLIKKINEEYISENWNKFKWDVAYALLGQSKDSLVKDINFSKHSVWSTISFGLTPWNLNMVGFNGQYDKNDKRPDWSLNCRFYAGVNKAKGFLETQYKYIGKDTVNNNNFTHNIFLNIGAEINIFDDFWATYYAGVNFDNLGENVSKNFDSHFDIRYGLP